MPKRIAYNKNRKAFTVKPTLAWSEGVKQFMIHLNGPGEASRYTIGHYQRDLDRFAAWWTNDPPRLMIPLVPSELGGVGCEGLPRLPPDRAGSQGHAP